MHFPPLPSNRQDGFSLPEIMVGMVIGMLGIFIIMQVSSFFEGQRRTTTGGDDAQNGAAIALHELHRDIEQAGYGISTLNQIDPARVKPFLIDQTLVTPYFTLNSLAPATVNPPFLAGIADAGSDTLLIIYGNSGVNSEGAIITNSAPFPYQLDNGTAQSGVAGTGGSGFTDGDWVTVDDGAPSGVVSATSTHYLYSVSGVSATHVPVAIPISKTQIYAAIPNTLAKDTVASSYPILFNLGGSPSFTAYAVIGGTLRVCDALLNNCAANANAWIPLISDITTMRAACEGNIGIRVALVARNSLRRDPNVVTTATPTWNLNNIEVDVEANPTATWGADWDHFRYKTVETYTPIRNAIWSGVRGCN